MKKLIFETQMGIPGFINRVFLAMVLFPHGAQKMLGSFGGYGFNGTMGYFTETVHLPLIVALLIILIEFVGPFALLLGFAARIWYASIAVLFTGIILTSHLSNGFFMNWFGNQAGEGYEFHLLVIGMALAGLIGGSGNWSIDKLINPES